LDARVAMFSTHCRQKSPSFSPQEASVVSVSVSKEALHIRQRLSRNFLGTSGKCPIIQDASHSSPAEVRHSHWKERYGWLL